MDIYEGFGFSEDDPVIKAADQMVESERQMMISLKSLREAKKISQQTVAKRMNADQSAVSRLENGHHDLRLSTLRRYALAVDAQVTFQVRPFDRSTTTELTTTFKTWESQNVQEPKKEFSYDQ